MPHSKPNCVNYISEELCAVSPGQPQNQCYDEKRGECVNFTAKALPKVVTVAELTDHKHQRQQDDDLRR